MNTTPVLSNRLMAIALTFVAAIHLHGQRTVNHLIFFTSDHADPAPEQIARIDSLLSAISILNIDQAHLIGYADATGNPAYNLELAERRVTAVTDLLIARGVAREAITAEAMGDKDPEGDNQTAEGRAKNRRVLIRFSVWDEEPSLPVTLNRDTCSVDTLIDLGRGATVTLGRCDARTLLECITFTRVYEPDESPNKAWT
ncbi:MAG: OmpA family protein [Flavobacteriales bacterium]